MTETPQTSVYEMKEADYPVLYRAADAASLSSQRVYTKTLSVYLFLLIAGAICSLFAGDTRISAIIGAFFFLLTLFLLIFIATQRPDRTWYNGRAVAESVKTRAWRYSMRTEPYDDSPNSPISRSKFLNDLKRILNDNQHLGHHLAYGTDDAEQLPSKMETIRSTPLETRINIYRDHRIDNQRVWYAKKAIQKRRSTQRWFALLVTFHALALICMIIRIAYPSWHLLPTEIFAVAAASVLSWIQVKRFQELATSYSLASHEISIIKGQLCDVHDERQFSLFVSDAENAFSREHTQWQARRDV